MKNHVGFDENTIRPVYFVEIDLPSGMFRANTADRNITHNGNLFYGIGNLGKISDFTTQTGTAATSLKFTLINIPATMVNEVANENTRNKPVTVYIGLLDESNNLVTDLIKWFYGTIDSMTVDLGQTVGVSASASSRLINWARSTNGRYTDEDQQSRHDDDRGFMFISGIPTIKLKWGS